MSCSPALPLQLAGSIEHAIERAIADAGERFETGLTSDEQSDKTDQGFAWAVAGKIFMMEKVSESFFFPPMPATQ
jgi:hypothetical protein